MFHLALRSPPARTASREQPFSPQTPPRPRGCAGPPSPTASAPTAPSAAASSSTPRAASSSTSRATREARSTRARSAPRGPTPSSSPSTRTASPRSCTAPLTRDHWETRPLDWALDRIAQRVKEARDADFSRNATSRAGRLNSRADHRHPRRGDARHRGKLPDQEAVRRRAGRRLHRESGPDMTQRLGARSGRLVRPRRGHHLSAGPGQQRLHPLHGLEHGRGPSRRLPLADEGQGARRRP